MSPRSSTKVAALALAATLAGAGPLRAQAAHPSPPDTAHAPARVELLTPGFARNVAIGVAGSLVFLPADEHVRAWVRGSARQNDAFLNHGVHDVMPLGSTVPIVAAVGLWGVGRVAHVPIMADVGLHVTEAIAGAGVISLVLKGAVGRARPFVPPHDADRFGRQSLRHPFDNGYESFPSGHATVAFATASSLTAEISAHWPGKQWVFGPLLYAGAASVAFGRVYLDKHWTSDVVAGAIIGGLVGNRVVRAVHSGGAGLLTRLNPLLVLLPGEQPMLGLRYALP